MTGINKEGDPLQVNEDLEALKISEEMKDAARDAEARSVHRKYRTEHMTLFPELYRSDVSIHPSYTGLKVLPYRVICRHRVQRRARQISRQLNREITHFAMIQMFALDGVRIDRVFSVGMSPKMTIVPDPLTKKERRRLNEILQDS